MDTPFFQKPEAEIRRIMAGMPASAVDAALRFRCSGDFSILNGLITEAIAIYRPKNPHQESPPSFQPESRLREDLGLDSLSLTEMAFMFDELFGIPIETREVAGILTLGQLGAFLKEKLTAPSPLSPSTSAR